MISLLLLAVLQAPSAPLMVYNGMWTVRALHPIGDGLAWTKTNEGHETRVKGEVVCGAGG